MKLYDLTQNYLQLLDMAEQLDEETFQDTLAAIQEPLEEKVENIAKMIRSLEADITAIKDEEKRLADRRKALETKVDNSKEFLKQQLELAGIDKVKRPLITVSIQNNPPSVHVVDIEKISSQFISKD